MPTSVPVKADTLPVNEMLNRYGVTASNVNFRSGPSTSSRKVSNTAVSAGKHVYLIRNEINADKEIWSCVNVDGMEGYIKSEFLYVLSETESMVYDAEQPLTASHYEPMSEQTPTLTSEPTFEPTAETTPEPTSEPTSMTTAEPVVPGEVLNRYARTTENVNFRTGPGRDNSVIKVLQKGKAAYMLVVEDRDGALWAKIMVDGEVGYILFDFLKPISIAESAFYDQAQATPAPVYSAEDLFMPEVE